MGNMKSVGRTKGNHVEWPSSASWIHTVTVEINSPKVILASVLDSSGACFWNFRFLGAYHERGWMILQIVFLEMLERKG